MNEMNEKPQSRTMSIAAMVCGILGIVGSFIPFVCYVTFILAILGIVFGCKAKKLATENNEPTGMATAGLVCGIIGTVLGSLGLLCVACAAGLATTGALAGM